MGHRTAQNSCDNLPSILKIITTAQILSTGSRGKTSVTSHDSYDCHSGPLHVSMTRNQLLYISAVQNCSISHHALHDTTPLNKGSIRYHHGNEWEIRYCKYSSSSNSPYLSQIVVVSCSCQVQSSLLGYRHASKHAVEYVIISFVSILAAINNNNYKTIITYFVDSL